MNNQPYYGIEFKATDNTPWRVIFTTQNLNDLRVTYEHLTEKNNYLASNYSYRCGVYFS